MEKEIVINWVLNLAIEFDCDTKFDTEEINDMYTALFFETKDPENWEFRANIFTGGCMSITLLKNNIKYGIYFYINSVGIKYSGSVDLSGGNNELNPDPNILNKLRNFVKKLDKSELPYWDEKYE